MYIIYTYIVTYMAITIAMYITVPKHTFMILECYFIIIGGSHQDDLTISLTLQLDRGNWRLLIFILA